MAPKLTDFMALRQSIEVPDDDLLLFNHGVTLASNYERPSDQRMRSEEHERATEAGEPPNHNHCDDLHDDSDPIITLSSTSKLAGQTVAPFLAKHIPVQYAPLGAQTKPKSSLQKDHNTKYCYRHRPDSKCRRTADEPTMENLQRELETLSQADQQGISHVWSLFSAAPAKHRNLMLQGILTQCCFPQLSYLSNAVRDLIRIDFFTALPNEISFKILSYLDTTSLCKAAQVSQRWRKLADDDLVWHKMCEQHIDRKCTKCGWGLPLLERRRLRDWKRQQQLRGVGRGLNEWSPNLTPMPEETGSTKMIRTSSNGSSKRDITNFLADGLPSSSPETSKRPCTNGVNGEQSLALAQPKFRPWKEVYKDRFKVGTNWKYGRYSTKVFRGHTNGIMCLQFDDNILATGSYDTTIKIWDINTGECLRTLRGHAVGVRALQFDDTKLISGSLDKKVKVWNWRTGECISTYEGGSMGIISVNFDGNLLASGSIDKSVKIWNFEDKSTFCLRGHKDWINAVRVDAESRTVFSASDDCTVRLWDLDTRRTIRTFEGHVGQVQQLILLPAEYEPDDPDAYEEIDDAASSTNSQASDQYTPPPPENTNTFADWPDSRPRPAKYMLTGGLDSTIRLWSVETGRCLKTFFGHVEGIWALAGDTLRFVSGAEDRMVKVWDARSGKCERTITGHAGPVTCLGLSDSRLVSGSEDCEVRVLDFRTEQGGDTNATTSASVVCTPAV